MQWIFIRISIGLILLVPWISNVSAETDEEMRQLYFKGEIVKIEELARSGNRKAQTWFGLMLQNRSQFSEALNWYTLAGEAGDFFAIEQAAFLYERGLGTPRDDAKAMVWHRRGAELGSTPSQLQYAYALLEGRGVTKDEAQAFHWYRAAADKKERYASLPLAKLYAGGIGTERDVIAAYAFAEIAEHEVDDSDESLRNQARALKEKLRAALSPEQIGRAVEQVYQERPSIRKANERKAQISLILDAILLMLVVLTGGLAGRAIWRRWHRASLPSRS